MGWNVRNLRRASRRILSPGRAASSFPCSRRWCWRRNGGAVWHTRTGCTYNSSGAPYCRRRWLRPGWMNFPPGSWRYAADALYPAEWPCAAVSRPYSIKTNPLFIHQSNHNCTPIRFNPTSLTYLAIQLFLIHYELVNLLIVCQSFNSQLSFRLRDWLITYRRDESKYHFQTTISYLWMLLLILATRSSTTIP